MQKRQDHILWTLESKQIEHLQVDIGDPNLEKERLFMRDNPNIITTNTGKSKVVLPPQIFNDEDYVGVCTKQLPDADTGQILYIFELLLTWNRHP